MKKLEKLLRESLSLKPKIIPEKEISILGKQNMVIISLTDKKRPIIMEAITEEQEQRIDKSKIYYGEIRYIKDNGIYIPASNIYMYGEIDVYNDDDLDVIEHFKLLHPKGSFMYSNFDYEKGTFTTSERLNKWSVTFNPIEWFKYNHVLLGKPKRIIVYKNPDKKTNRYVGK